MLVSLSFVECMISTSLFCIVRGHSCNSLLFTFRHGEINDSKSSIDDWVVVEICVEHRVGRMSGSSKRPFHRRGTSVRLAPASLLDRHGLLEMREDDRPRAYHADF